MDTSTDEEKLAFQRERQSRLDAMTERERKAYLDVTEKALQETVKEARRFVERAEDALLRDKLGEIPEVISLSYIADEERKKFVAAINDISDMLKKTSLSLG